MMMVAPITKMIAEERDIRRCHAPMMTNELFVCFIVMIMLRRGVPRARVANTPREQWFVALLFVAVGLRYADTLSIRHTLILRNSGDACRRLFM